VDHQDTFWVERALREDHDAFGLLVAKYTPALHRFVQRKIGVVDDVPDLVQETWLQAYLSLPRLRTTEKFAAWLHGVALNLIRSWYRRNQAAYTMSWETLEHNGEDREEHLVQLNAASLDDQIMTRAVGAAVLGAVSQLSTINREVIRLHYLDDLSYQQVAERLSIPEKTVRSRLYKARQLLKMQLEDLIDVPVSVAESKPKEVTMHEATIYDVYHVAKSEPEHAHLLVVLKIHEQQRYLPLWIGWAEGEGIAMQLRGIQPPRPLTYDLMTLLLDRLGGRLIAITLTTIKNKTFYAQLRIVVDNAIQEIDCRPSDALALAVRTNAAIIVAPEVLEQAGRDAPISFLEHLDQPAVVAPLQLDLNW